MHEIIISSSPNISIRINAGDSIANHVPTLFPGVAERTLLACKVNGMMTSLHAPLIVSATIQPVLVDDQVAFQIRRRSLCFGLAAIVSKFVPNRGLTIGHAIGRGFFYHFATGIIDTQLIEFLEREMSILVRSHLPIRSVQMGWAELVTRLETAGRSDTVELLHHHNEHIVDCYELADFIDLDHGILCAWTDQLPNFTISIHDDGFILDYPQTDSVNELPKVSRSPLIFSIYQEYKRWGQILGLGTVGQLNALTGKRQIKDFIWVAEALHQQKIAELANQITLRSHELKVILIAGPSSSGKTTFAKKLSIQLTVSGLKPIALSLDDYFVPREQTPRDTEGNYDFEHLKALDIALLNEQLLNLSEGKEIEIPSFDFREGVRKYNGKKLSLPSGGVIVLEGIHGLNSALTERIAPECKFHIYISALTQLNIDSLNRISTTDNRLLRRMVRDSHYRGHSAESTLSMWSSVRRGEDHNIFPFQDFADSAFNSALDYELGVLKTYAEPLLESVGPSSPWYHDARRLLHFLESFLPIPAEYVPENSILREFIGGSVYKY